MRKLTISISSRFLVGKFADQFSQSSREYATFQPPANAKFVHSPEFDGRTVNSRQIEHCVNKPIGDETATVAVRVLKRASVTHDFFAEAGFETASGTWGIGAK